MESSADLSLRYLKQACRGEELATWKPYCHCWPSHSYSRCWSQITSLAHLCRPSHLDNGVLLARAAALMVACVPQFFTEASVQPRARSGLRDRFQFSPIKATIAVHPLTVCHLYESSRCYQSFNRPIGRLAGLRCMALSVSSEYTHANSAPPRPTSARSSSSNSTTFDTSVAERSSSTK